MTTWLVPAMLIDGTGAAPRTDVAVGFGDEVIRAVVPTGELSPAGDDVVVEADGMTLLPGFVDSHVHLTFDHGVDHETTRRAFESRSDEELVALGFVNAQACLRAGVTTVRDLGARGTTSFAIRDAVKGGSMAGPRILASGPPITTSHGHLHWCGAIADEPFELEATIDSLCTQGADVIKIVATGGYMTAESDPLKAQYSSEALVAAGARAHRHGRRVAAHVLNAKTIADLVVAEIDTLEHCRWADPDGGVAYDANVAAEIAKREIWVGITMAGPDRELLSSDLSTLRDRHRTVREMLDAGGRIMISSDAGVRTTRFDEFALSIICAVEGVGLSVCEAIHRSTLVPADALGLAGEVGSIESGKRADLVLVAGDPVTDTADLQRVRQVWLDGRLVVSEGALVGEPVGP